jgi:hypothetical protein
VTDPGPNRDIAWYAELLDRTAVAAESDFELALNVGLELGFGLRTDLPDDTSNEVRAVVWAFSYVVELHETDQNENSVLGSDESAASSSAVMPDTCEMRSSQTTFRSVATVSVAHTS